MAPPTVRRQLNQACFEKIWVGPHGINGAELAAPFAQLLDPKLLGQSDNGGQDKTNPTPLSRARVRIMNAWRRGRDSNPRRGMSPLLA
jgi:hypothetical protein